VTCSIRTQKYTCNIIKGLKIIGPNGIEKASKIHNSPSVLEAKAKGHGLQILPLKKAITPLSQYKNTLGFKTTEASATP